MTEWRRKNPEKAAAARKRQRARLDPAAERARVRRSWHKHKPNRPPKTTRGKRDRIKENAKRRAKDALKRGVLVKPANCQQCGKKTVVLHKHHADYLKPLDVEFLCVDCHAARHRKDVASL